MLFRTPKVRSLIANLHPSSSSLSHSNKINSSPINAMSSSAASSNIQGFVDTFNANYAAKHFAFEQQFWGTKMALKAGAFNADLLASTKKDMEDLLGSKSILEEAKKYRDAGVHNDNNNNNDLAKTLDIIIRTCECNDLPEGPKAIREETSQLESQLEMARNQMELGYRLDGSDDFVKMSSVGLRNLMRTSGEEAVRKAAYQGLRSIGPFVCQHGFVDIVKKRNQMAKALGFKDYYDYKVTNAEGFDKDQLFEILDNLEHGTRPTLQKAKEELKKRHGETACEPWNTSYMTAGSIVKKMDPYFPFSKSVERYMRSYAALGIKYCGATLNLDLLDRPNKYSNGFCHWPVPAWKKPDGHWQPSVANFTSLANPSAVGSGLTALTTLMHEAGHAAHFANIQQPSPLFSQERAPTSVAYAENQSMFLDSLVGDAAWRAKYAKSLDGKAIPFEIIEEGIRATHPFAVFQLRAMLSVSYFEKALYELPEEEITAENIQKLADEIEVKIQGGFSPRPLLSVPHLISDEASCYYQGYTLAEMSVHQTRSYFKNKYGFIVDNPNVGPSLTSVYWECGNSRPFLHLVKDLTGKELSGNDWISVLQENVEDKIAREKKEYNEMIEKEMNQRDDDGSDLDLEMTVRFVDGDEVIADSSQIGLLGACKEFEKFVDGRIAAQASA